MKAQFGKWDKQVVDDFVKWYNEQTITKPSIEAFFRLEFEFQIGVYLRYLESKLLIVALTNIGYKIKHMGVDQIIIEEKEPHVDFILNWYEVGINRAFQWLSDPFA